MGSACLCSSSGISPSKSGFCCFPFWLTLRLYFLLYFILSACRFLFFSLIPIFLDQIPALFLFAFLNIWLLIPTLSFLLIDSLPSSSALFLTSVHFRGTFCTLPPASFHHHPLVPCPLLPASHRTDFLLCPAWGSRWSTKAEGGDRDVTQKPKDASVLCSFSVWAILWSWLDSRLSQLCYHTSFS